MTVLRRLDGPTGLRPGDHVCWTFASAEDFSTSVRLYLDEGRRRGEQLLLSGPSEPALLEALVSLPERDELLASGQLAVRVPAEMSDCSAALDPVARVQAFRREVDAALHRGRSGLRIAADVSALARRELHERRRLHLFERLADAIIGTVPMTALCLYDASLQEDVLRPLNVLHPDQHDGEREPLVHLSGRGPWMSLHGEVDATEADALLRALVDVASAVPGEVVLDLAELEFLDVAGARTLARATRLLAEVGVQLRIVRPRRLVGHCLGLFDVAAEQEVSA